MSHEMFLKYLIEYIFLCSTHGFHIELYDSLYSILRKVYTLRIRVLEWHIAYIVQGFDMKFKKMLSTALTFIWDPTSASMKLRKYQVFFLTDTGFCSEIFKYALFHFFSFG